VRRARVGPDGRPDKLIPRPLSQTRIASIHGEANRPRGPYGVLAADTATAVSGIEAESRLRSVREVLERGRHALTRIDDDRLDAVVQAMEELEAAIVICAYACSSNRLITGASARV
jgi:hypothetical protein